MAVSCAISITFFFVSLAGGDESPPSSPIPTFPSTSSSSSSSSFPAPAPTLLLSGRLHQTLNHQFMSKPTPSNLGSSFLLDEKMRLCNASFACNSMRACTPVCQAPQLACRVELRTEPPCEVCREGGREWDLHFPTPSTVNKAKGMQRPAKNGCHIRWASSLGMLGTRWHGVWCFGE